MRNVQKKLPKPFPRAPQILMRNIQKKLPKPFPRAPPIPLPSIFPACADACAAAIAAWTKYHKSVIINFYSGGRKAGGLEVSAEFSNFSLRERIAHQAIVGANLFGNRMSDDMRVRQNVR